LFRTGPGFYFFKESVMPTTQQIIPGDCIEGMRTLPDASVHCCVTSPPYWLQRDYGHDGQIGLEDTPEAYVARMVEVFREVRRVLRDDGTCWVNLGDSYAATGVKQTGRADSNADSFLSSHAPGYKRPEMGPRTTIRVDSGLKPKDLVGIPWRVAFALQADGWLLRQDIIWHKPNPMPEGVTDRCTKAHEYVFLLTKSAKYWYDAEAIQEKALQPIGDITTATGKGSQHKQAVIGQNQSGKSTLGANQGKPTRNRRSVWTISTRPYSGAHFAVMPADLVEPCIKAGCPEGGTVLDPFAGSGTTLAVAAEQGRSGIGCELNPEYIALAKKRIREARESVALFDGIS
jgi:DNA modification methylase